MAATNYSGNGRRNFYNVSYGKLSTRTKEVGEDLTEIKEDELKSLTKKVENIDLRGRYQVKTGDYPYSVYYDTIEGTIQDIRREEYTGGISLHVDLLDSDEELSTVQIKFYSKYTENLLNRLINVANLGNNLTFTPYAIPAEFEIEGKTVKVYNQGVSVREDGVKVENKYRAGDEKLPPTEQIQTAEGKSQTSRVKRINFLFDELMSKYQKTEKPVEKTSTKKTIEVEEEDDSDLPF